MGQEKYCPAGKCECMFFHSPIYCGWPSGETSIDRMEVCPWPSRQQIVEPPVDFGKTDERSFLELALKTNWASGESQWKFIHAVFTAGLAEGIRRCREAVEKLLPDFLVGVDCSGGFNKPTHLVEVGAHKRGAILAAIDAVKGE